MHTCSTKLVSICTFYTQYYIYNIIVYIAAWEESKSSETKIHDDFEIYSSKKQLYGRNYSQQ